MQNEHHRLPVTALASWRHLIFAGEGHNLCIYDPDSASPDTPIRVTKIFERQSIHGILVDGRQTDAQQTTLFVWGGTNLRFVSVSVHTDSDSHDANDDKDARRALSTSSRALSSSPQTGFWTLHSALRL